MKKMTCRELRGACDTIITGNTPEEMGENSKKHVMQMVQEADQAHLDAIADMQQLSEEDQQEWYEDFKKKFDEQPEA